MAWKNKIAKKRPRGDLRDGFRPLFYEKKKPAGVNRRFQIWLSICCPPRSVSARTACMRFARRRVLVLGPLAFDGSYACVARFPDYPRRTRRRLITRTSRFIALSRFVSGYAQMGPRVDREGAAATSQDGSIASVYLRPCDPGDRTLASATMIGTPPWNTKLTRDRR